MLIRTHAASLSIATTLAALAAPALGDIVNGDFEAGNTGFLTSYVFTPANVFPYVNQYGITQSSFAWSNFWNNVPGDHTTGNGLFLIVDVGSTNTVWQQTVSVTPGTAYTLGAWIATWTSFTGATLGVEINGSLVTAWDPAGAAWAERTASWNSGISTAATIRLYATTLFQPGDDVAIDDITFVPTPGAAGLLGLGAAGLLRRRR